eukprot:364612-Chlamydomonas_euryale.AAC.19
MAPQAQLGPARPGRLMEPTVPLPSMAMWGKEKKMYFSRPSGSVGECDRPAPKPVTPQVMTPPRPLVLNEQPNTASILSFRMAVTSSRHRLVQAACTENRIWKGYDVASPAIMHSMHAVGQGECRSRKHGKCSRGRRLCPLSSEVVWLRLSLLVRDAEQQDPIVPTYHMLQQHPTDVRTAVHICSCSYIGQLVRFRAFHIMLPA